MKDIFQFAIEFEQENQEFYRDCAENAENEKLQEVFLELAEEEEKHERIVRDLARDRSEEEVESDIVTDAREAFQEIAADFERDPSGALTADQVDVYLEARELERKSNSFYSEKSAETDDKRVAEAFKKLAREEKKHEEILENIIQMVDKPNTWLEDPEWYHLDEY